MSGAWKQSNKTKLSLLLALLLIGLALWGRFIPHAPNLAPLGAIALFAGAILPRRWALIVPVAAIIISDLFIGLHSVILWTWGSYLLIAWISRRYLRGQMAAANIASGAVVASGLFYVLTNFGVWLQGGLYPLTGQGLVASYINGLPFLRYTLLGDLAYSATLFGLYFVAYRIISPHSMKKSATNF